MTHYDDFLDDGFAEINALSQRCLRTLSILNGRIAEGRAPDADAFAAELDRIRRLDTLHERIRRRAADLLGPDDKPDPDIPIDALADLVHRRRDALTARLGNIRRLLVAFLGVTATGQAYATALDPLLARARELLALAGSDDVDMDGLEERTTPMRLFLQAVQLADRDGDEAEALFARLDGYLPSTAARGLAMGRYACAAITIPKADARSEPGIRNADDGSVRTATTAAASMTPEPAAPEKPAPAAVAVTDTPSKEAPAPVFGQDATAKDTSIDEPTFPNARIVKPATPAAATKPTGSGSVTMADVMRAIPSPAGTKPQAPAAVAVTDTPSKEAPAPVSGQDTTAKGTSIDEPTFPNARIVKPATPAAATKPTESGSVTMADVMRTIPAPAKTKPQAPAVLAVTGSGLDTTLSGKLNAAIKAKDARPEATTETEKAPADEGTKTSGTKAGGSVLAPVKTKTTGHGLDTTLSGKLNAAIKAKDARPEATTETEKAPADEGTKPSGPETVGKEPTPADDAGSGIPADAVCVRAVPIMDPPSIDESKVWDLEYRYADKRLHSMLQDVRKHPEKAGVFRVLLACGVLTKEHMLRFGRPRGFFDNVPSDKVRQAVDRLCNQRLLVRIRDDGYALPSAIFMINALDKPFQLLPPGQCVTRSERLSDRAAAEALACVDALTQCFDLRSPKDKAVSELKFRGPGRIMVRIAVGDERIACRVVPPFMASCVGEAVLVPLPGRREPGDFAPNAAKDAANASVLALCDGGAVFRLDGSAWTEIVPPIGALPYADVTVLPGTGDDGDKAAGTEEAATPEVRPTADAPARQKDADGAATDAIPIKEKRPEPSDGDDELPASAFHPESLGLTQPDPSPADLDAPRGPNAVSDEAARLLALHEAPGSTPSDDEIHDLAILSLRDARPPRVLNALPDGLADALLLLGTLPGDTAGFPRCTQLKADLEAAAGLPGDAQVRAGFRLAGLFHGGDPSDAACRLAAFMLALFRPAMAPRDYQLIKLAHEHLADFPDMFPDFDGCHGVFGMLVELADTAPGGFTETVLATLDDKGVLDKERAVLRGTAKALSVGPKFKTMLTGIPELSVRIFGPSGMFSVFIAAAADGLPEADDMAADIATQFTDDGRIDENRLNAFLDREWDAATADLTSHVKSLVGILRKKILSHLRERIELAVGWARRSAKTDERTVSVLGDRRKTLTDELRAARDATASGDAPFRVVVVNALDRMLKALTDRRVFVPPFAGLLRSGHFSVDCDGLPVIDRDTDGILGFEPWRRALGHVADTTSTLASAFHAVSEDKDSPMYDDLQRLELLGWCLGKDEAEFRSSDDDTAKAGKLADIETKNLRGRLSADCTYGRIAESDKDRMLRTIETLHDRFFGRRDLGQWRELLRTIRGQADGIALVSSGRLRKRLEEKAAGLPEDMRSVVDRIGRTLDGGNCAVAEDMLNRLAGDADGISGFDDGDALADFLSEDVFDKLLGLCPRGGESFKKKARGWLEENMPSVWTVRQKSECLEMVQLWPDRAPWPGYEDKLAVSTAELFRHLRIDVTDERPTVKKCQSGYLIALGVRGTAPHLQEYPHPFKEFGTKLRKLRVVVMFGGHDPRDIVEEITLLNLDGPTVLLIDHQLDRPARRQLAEACHKKSGLATFLMLDRVLFLHLAPRPETERLPLLLKCALPFAAPLQPFSQGSGPTDDEMFCGRTAELRSVLDPKGACVVYGGRQLGKTALLQRAERMFSRPEDGKFAVLVDIKDRADEASVTGKIVDRVREAAGRKAEEAVRVKAPQSTVDILRRIAKLPDCEGLDDLCRELGGLSGENGLKILLLVDEADAFLGAIADSGYAALNPLVELRRRTDDFKFVLAGLNNVCRARNAMADNGIFGQMGEPLCVSPLSPRDAFALISRPLECLGFRTESDELLPTILANTNYYPGIIQLFGRTIVESLRTDYAANNWSARTNPPFPLTERLLGRIMDSSDIQRVIREKFQMTLDIDRSGKRHYYLLPLCIAMLSSENGPLAASRGFTVEEVRTVAAKHVLESITECTDGEIEGLLDEMTGMGILCHCEGDGPNRYRFLRGSFLDIMGKDVDEIGRKLDAAAYEAMERKEVRA